MADISVIIPVYNAENTIDAILRDVRKQTFEDIEIIVVDDNSTDSSKMKILKHQQEDARIILAHSDTKGASGARNKGLQLASGEFIRFLDADDRIPDNSIERMYTAIICGNDSNKRGSISVSKDKNAARNIDLVIGRYKYLSDSKSYMCDQVNGIKNAEELAGDFAKHMKSFYYGAVWNKLYRKEIIDNNKVRFDEKLFWCEDLLFNVQYFENSSLIYYLNDGEEIYEYIEGSNTVTSQLKNIDITIAEEIQQICFERVSVYLEKYIPHAEFEKYWNWGKRYANLCDYIEANNTTGKYKYFVDCMSSPAFYEEIEAELKEYPDAYIYKRILKRRGKKRHYMLFAMFYIKGKIKKNVSFLLPYIRSIVKRPPRHT